MRAIGDESRNAEPWSNDEDDTRIGTLLPKYSHRTHMMTRNLGRFNVHHPLLAEFTPKLSASSVERLANQRLHLARD
ncbi:hypothetical protein TNCV_1570521 [Trichonephila clavipes]|uniref:Uncharacterized protein n=1 Tax=Trichonephila clavipes TaxID=2585209 RepID=A0A8X6SN82_TRICX|nr:hypothetical protein TNCV_1570521 [Trichonephila clavipes]